MCGRILQVCHVVLFKQLSCWLLYGSLQDQYEEFFIKQASESDLSSSAVADVPSGDDLDVSGVTGKQLSLIMASTFRSFHYYFLLYC